MRFYHLPMINHLLYLHHWSLVFRTHSFGLVVRGKPGALGASTVVLLVFNGSTASQLLPFPLSMLYGAGWCWPCGIRVKVIHITLAFKSLFPVTVCVRFLSKRWITVESSNIDVVTALWRVQRLRQGLRFDPRFSNCGEFKDGEADLGWGGLATLEKGNMKSITWNWVWQEQPKGGAVLYCCFFILYFYF